MAEDGLDGARARIDAIDREILRLINERASVAQEVAHIKMAAVPEAERGKLSFYRPEREAQVLRRLRDANAGPLDDDTVVRFFREIMSACLALERPLSVAYLGPEGTYTQAAVLKHFGSGVHARPLTAIDEIFREVEASLADYGVVPVENSTEGVVSHTLDLFVASPLKISGEVALPIHHHLLSGAARLADVKRIYAHAQSFAQARKWLDGKLPNVARQAVSSNAEAARIAASETGAAAIAGRAAAQLYGLDVLAANIEDEPDNTTRFLVIGRKSVPPSGHDLTSLLLSSPHARNRPGALYRLLLPFADAGVNLTRIESRPTRRMNWDYHFFIDFEGHAEEAGVRQALERIEDTGAMVKILGSYPRAVR